MLSFFASIRGLTIWYLLIQICVDIRYIYRDKKLQQIDQTKRYFGRIKSWMGTINVHEALPTLNLDPELLL